MIMIDIKNLDNIGNHWIATSNDDFQTMIELYNSESYNWSLFPDMMIIKENSIIYVHRNLQNYGLIE